MDIELKNENGKILRVKYSLTNVHVYDSYKISRADIMGWIRLIKEYGAQHSYTYSRSDKSWCREWKAHNLLTNWGVATKRTKDVDLSENESVIRRIMYVFLSILYI